MDINAFRGYRYAADVVGDPGLAISPPYDVIDGEEQEKLHKRSPYNIARVIKAQAAPTDSGPDCLYGRASEALASFIRDGALKQDAQAAIYAYVQHFEHQGRRYQRTGFVALGKLADYGGPVRPHEHTLVGPKADRLKLMRATRSQIGQIFVLYSDVTGTIDEILAQAAGTEALVDHVDDDGVRHQLFAVTDAERITTVEQVMQDKDVFIADGHHRYETALEYYRETQDPAAAWLMMTFVNTHNEGLLVLPTHRLVRNLADFSVANLLDKMNEHFDVARLAYGDVVEKSERRRMMQDALDLEFQNGDPALGMYFNDGAFYVATLRDAQSMTTATSESSHAYCRLDVAVLHKLILEDLLGIDQTHLTEESHVEYIKDFGDATAHAIDRVDEGSGQGLFFLNPTRVSDVDAVVAAGEKMPQKSTFFFPKVFSGLVINMLDNRKV